MSKHSTTYLAARDEFVQLWGDMASSWGINKTMSQIHALLYAESQALHTDEIMSILGISRGNANMNLRRLLDWELIHKVQFEGDRKDYFSAETDVWKIVNTIIRERQQREIAPIRARLEECVTLLEGDTTQSDELDPASQEFKERIQNYNDFLVMFERFTDALLPFITKKNLTLLKQLVRFVEAKERLSELLSPTSEEKK
jgi:DNA-binding transcriptional regulator GbsR (MarR family)